MKVSLHFLESGRTLVEMLGALAIMGILSIVGLSGYRYALETTKANNVLYDARTIHTLMICHQNPQSGTWVENTDTTTTTSYTFYKMYDKALKPFIKVFGIEKGICKKMIQMSSDKVSFLTSENTPFTTCGDENEMVVNFDTEGVMATCATQSDCLGVNEICLDGQCSACGAHRKPNKNHTECICDEGYTGDLCDTCDNNYIMKENECIPCPNGTGTNTDEFLGNALTSEYVGCYCENTGEWWCSVEQKCVKNLFDKLDSRINKYEVSAGSKVNLRSGVGCVVIDVTGGTTYTISHNSTGGSVNRFAFVDRLPASGESITPLLVSISKSQGTFTAPVGSNYLLVEVGSGGLATLKQTLQVVGCSNGDVL